MGVRLIDPGNIVRASDSSPARELAVAPNEGLQERGGSPLGACDIRMVWIWTTSAIPETLLKRNPQMTLAERARERNELRKRAEPLLPELRRFVRGDMLRHPFVIADLDPGHAGLLNAKFLEVSREVKDARVKEDFSKYINLHEKPYRIDALAKCRDFGLSGPDYWSRRLIHP